MSSNSEQPVPADWRLALALALMFVGMTAGLVAVLVDLSIAAFSFALAVFLAGGVSAAVLAYRDARASRISVPRAIGRALKMLFSWVFTLP